MAALTIILYLPLLGMTMVLLFIDSPLPQRRIATAIYGTMALVIAVVILVCWMWRLQTLIRHRAGDCPPQPMGSGLLL